MSSTRQIKYFNSRRIIGFSVIHNPHNVAMGCYVRYKKRFIGYVCAHYHTHCTICFGRMYKDLNVRNLHHYELVVLARRGE